MSSEFPTVLILAGGRGTRLGVLSDTAPKAMMPVAGAPFIDHQLNLLAQNGVEHVVLCVSYLADQIRNHVGSGSKYSLKVDYAEDGEHPLGTGGAVINALKFVGGDFAVLYGDTYLDIDYRAAYKAFKGFACAGLMTVLANANQWERSNILFREGQVVRYDKTCPSDDMMHIDYGLSLFRLDAFDKYPPGMSFDLTKVFQDLIAEKQMAGYEVFQRFYEIGTPSALELTERFLSERPVQR